MKISSKMHFITCLYFLCGYAVSDELYSFAEIICNKANNNLQVNEINLYNEKGENYRDSIPQNIEGVHTIFEMDGLISVEYDEKNNIITDVEHQTINFNCTLGDDSYHVEIKGWKYNYNSLKHCGYGPPSISLTLEVNSKLVVQDLIFNYSCYDNNNFINSVSINANTKKIEFNLTKRRARYKKELFIDNAIVRGDLFNGDSTGNLDADLIIAIGENNLNEVSGILEKGANPNSINMNGNTALYLAANNQRNLSMVKVILENGANPNSSKDQYGVPLHLAAMRGDNEITKVLLESGARVDGLRNGSNVLFWSVHNAQYGNSFTRGYKKQRPANFEETIRLLLNYGADPKHRGKRYKRNAIEEARKLDLKNILNILSKNDLSDNAKK